MGLAVGTAMGGAYIKHCSVTLVTAEELAVVTAVGLAAGAEVSIARGLVVTR